jgi:hypothetical protein
MSGTPRYSSPFDKLRANGVCKYITETLHYDVVLQILPPQYDFRVVAMNRNP